MFQRCVKHVSVEVGPRSDSPVQVAGALQLVVRSGQTLGVAIAPWQTLASLRTLSGISGSGASRSTHGSVSSWPICFILDASKTNETSHDVAAVFLGASKMSMMSHGTAILGCIKETDEPR